MAARNSVAKKVKPVNENAGRKSQVSQKDIPAVALDDALRIPTAIAENYAYKPTAPLMIAKAMSMQPNSGTFRMLCSAAQAYGLTNAAAYAPMIGIEPLGMRILRPTMDGDDRIARREALMQPRIVSAFLRKYDGAPIPQERIGISVLQELGIPIDRAKDAYYLIVQSAQTEGMIVDVNGKKYVHLAGNGDVQDSGKTEVDLSDKNPLPQPPLRVPEPKKNPTFNAPAKPSARERKVYISHGKNKAFVEPIKNILTYGDLEPIVSVDIQTVSQPVPEKITSEMRECGAAIIHVDAETKLKDEQGNEQIVVNSNVLIELGAAMALYGKRYILLVKDGVTLPSNLQGLLKVPYSGDVLDSDATVRLMQAIKDIKNHPLPPISEGKNES